MQFHNSKKQQNNIWLRNEQNPAIYFLQFFLSLISMDSSIVQWGDVESPTPTRRYLLDFVISYKLYGSPAITEEGGSLLRMLRTVGIPSIQLNTTLHNWERINKTFFEASLKCFYLAASPLPSLANIYFKTFMNKNQIEEKQCRGEHGRC